MFIKCNQLSLISLVILLAFSASAKAGALKKCEGISTDKGFKYVGTYCADYECKYVFTRVFDNYCPYNSD